MNGDSPETTAAPGDLIADVLVPVAVDTSYSYKVPAGMALATPLDQSSSGARKRGSQCGR